MYKNKTIGVVVPAYNEEILISKTLSTMPDYVDYIISIDDHSHDKTLKLMKKHAAKDKRIYIIHNKKNQGLGRTIAIGYKKARELKADITALMAGDAQMDPKDLPKLLEPIIEGKADYVKGNRFMHTNFKKNMPAFRIFGNAILTILTKFATGYWHILDPQCGYTTISNKAINSLDLDGLHKGYGYNADYLCKLNILNYRVTDVTINPVYGDEVSGIKYYTYVPKVSFLLMKLFLFRLKEKYILRDFHPLVFMYFIGFLSSMVGAALGVYLFYIDWVLKLNPTSGSSILVAFLLLFGIQLFLFGMLFDSEYSRRLYM